MIREENWYSFGFTKDEIDRCIDIKIKKIEEDNIKKIDKMMANNLRYPSDKSWKGLKNQ